MKSFSNELYKDIYEPESFEELLGIICNATESQRYYVYMWRGQASIDWRIDTSAYRRLSLHKNVVKEADVITYEERLLKHAKHKGFHYLNGSELSDLELLSRLQHHGAATRLLDFSRSALIALWFCVSSLPKETGLLLGIHTHYLGGYEGELDQRTYKEVVKELPKYSVQTWEPPVVTPRIAAQHSQFVYSDVSMAPTGSLKLPPEEGSKSFIAVTPAMKDKAKAILSSSFDIRGITIFPDVDGFGHANSVAISPDDMLRW